MKKLRKIRRETVNSIGDEVNHIHLEVKEVQRSSVKSSYNLRNMVENLRNDHII